MNVENHERLITTGELSRLVGCHPATIHHWVKQGQIPGLVRLGKALRFRQSVIELWLRGETKNEKANVAEAQ